MASLGGSAPGVVDGILSAAKNQVIASDHLQSTFEIATNFLNWALDSKISYSTVNCKSRISTVTTGRGGGHNSRRGRGGGRGGQGFGRGKGKGKIWHDYYTNEEWQQLTAPQKQQVRDQRAERNKCRNIEVLGTGDTKRSKINENSTNENEAIGMLDPKVSSIGAVMSQQRTNSNSNNKDL